MKDKTIDINEMYFATIEGEDKEGNFIYGNVTKLENNKKNKNNKNIKI